MDESDAQSIAANIAALPPLRATIAAHGLDARKRLGQHFLLDLNLTRRIARAAAPLTPGTVIEIGPGPGGLTRALLLEGAQHVVAIEVDERATLALQELETAAQGRLRIIQGDALEMELAEVGPPPRRVVANLPYNVAVPLVMRVLEEAPQVSSLLVMVQKEVGERMAAGARDEAYGAVSVKVAYWATATLVGKVPATVFIPKPKVESVLVKMDRRDDLPTGDDGGPAGPGSPSYDRLFAVVRGGFAHRRKMLRRALEDLVTAEAFIGAGIAPTARAEELDLAEWQRLAWWQPEAPAAL